MVARTMRDLDCDMMTLEANAAFFRSGSRLRIRGWNFWVGLQGATYRIPSTNTALGQRVSILSSHCEASFLQLLRL